METQALNAATDPHDKDWSVAMRLPCNLALEVPVPSFTVRDLLRLDDGAVIATKWSQGTDIPIRANGCLIGWTEFEVVGERLAIRITELA